MAVCPACGKEGPDDFRFCPVCATPLEQQPHAHAEERKVVSILFVDLVGFTARSHDADPEDVRAALAPYHQLLKREIERFGGTVEKFIGDAVMAVFGAPVAHEDDAERAVRAALRIAEAIDELNAATPKLDLSIRAAVNTGEGLVTLGARPHAGEGMVTGDVVNTASRLQNVAPVNGLVVGEVTYRSTMDVIEYEQLGDATVKGKPHPVPVWRAVSARSRFGVDVDVAPRTPFIGRDFDLAALKNTYFRTLRESSVQLVTITGEPGVGKTRLLAEFSSFVDDQEQLVQWRQGRSLPYGEGVTYWALGEVVKAQAGIFELDSPEIASDKLRVAVEAVVEDSNERTWFTTRLGPLVGARSAQSRIGADKEESFTAWRRFLEAIALRNPLVVVFEDLHWADAAMLAFIDHLVEWSTGVPLLVVCTARPELYERHESWGGGKRNSNTISLSSLSDSETAQLISALLSEAVLPTEVQAALVERAGGNPLYTEEFIRMLSDRGILHRNGRVLTLEPDADISMPDNVHALIAARLDTLPAERKALLHDASVAGKVFWSGAVAALGGRNDRVVREGLHELARKELVRPARNSSMEGQQEYSFWHALVRDVSYGQIPRAERGKKHHALAKWIESKASDRVADHAELLAYHYGTALELASATDSIGDQDLVTPLRASFVAAGDYALPLDPTKAALFYKKSLMHYSVDDPDRAVVISSLARALGSAGEFAQATTLYEEAIDRLLATGKTLRAGESLAELSFLAWEQGKEQEAVLATMNQAIEVLEREPPGSELARAYSYRSAFETLSGGDPVKGIEWADRSLGLADKLQAPALSVGALDRRGIARVQLGDEEAVLDLQESVRLGLEHGLGLETAISYTNLVHFTGMVEGPARALHVAQEAVAFMRQRGIFGEMMWTEGNACVFLYELGRWDDVLTETGKLIAWCKEHQAVRMEVFAATVKAMVHVCRSQLTEAAALERSFLEPARTIRDPQTILPALTAAAMISAAESNLGLAVELIEEFEVCGRNGPTETLAFSLPDALRLCQKAKAVDLAALLLKNAETRIPYLQRFLFPARAIFAEMEQHIDHSLVLYVEAARRWKDYGHVLEEGFAHFGTGRCLRIMARTDEAVARLHEARAIFTKLNAPILIDEVDRYLGQATALSS